MANRPSLGGFRWAYNKFAPNSNTPPIREIHIASGYATALYRGDPVATTTDGSLIICPTNTPVYGIFLGMKQLYNATDGVVAPSGRYVASTVWGTVTQRMSIAYVIPVRGQIFRVTVDENTTATTLAAYLDMIQENADFATGTPVVDQSGYLLDVSTNATTAEDCRIENVPDRDTTNFAATGVELEVSFNLIQDTASGSTTGV